MSTFSRFFNVFIGIIFVIFGVYLWGNPVETLVTYSLYLGFTHIAVSIATVTFFLMKKIKPVPWGSILVSFMIGLTILALPLVSLTVILWMFILGFLIASIYSFMKVTKENGRYHTIQIALSIIALAYGIFMVLRPDVAANTMAKIIAAFVILNGISYIFPSHDY